MASGGHLLQQQKGSVETRIKVLVNSDLKEICKAYDYQVSGNKAVLQKRCIEVLTNIVNRGDSAGFREFNYRVNNHGAAPPRAAHQSSSSSSQSYIQQNGYGSSFSSMPPGAQQSQFGARRLPPGGKYFKPNPFWEAHEEVLRLTDLPDVPEMPQNRHSLRQTINLTPDHATRLRSDPSLKLLLYCGHGVNQYSAVDVAFPAQVEIKINNDDIRANFKGLKHKPGTTKPADITDKVRKNPGYPNQLSITYALTRERYAVAVYLARHVPVETLTQRIRDGKHGGGIISKQRVLEELTRANADPDIATTSVRMSLKDPISTLRISLPVRSTVCTHNQCFDGAMFIQLQDQAPQWACPICSKAVSYESLCVDKYFEEILQKTPSSIEKVDIEPDGEWRLIKEEEAQPENHSSRENRASYDDDFDDDEVIELDDVGAPKLRTSNGVHLGSSATPSFLSPMSRQGVAMNTPPLSSRGPSAAPSTASLQQGTKRPSSAVIDLTLSDDEDEPPRSAKRQSTVPSTHPGTSTQPAHSYSTPNSLPDPRIPSFYSGPSNVTDSMRQPISNTTRPPSSQSRSSAAPEPFNALQFGSTGFGGSTGSPFRAGNSASPSISLNSGSNWAQQYAQPQPQQRDGPGNGSISSNSTFQPFTIRQPSAPHNQNESWRLPPIDPNPSNGLNGYPGGWPSDSYSHSPPG